MLDQSKIMIRAGNEKYREQYDLIFPHKDYTIMDQCAYCKTLNEPICGQHGPLGSTVCDERKAMMK